MGAQAFVCHCVGEGYFFIFINGFKYINILNQNCVKCIELQFGDMSVLFFLTVCHYKVLHVFRFRERSAEGAEEAG